MPNRTFSLYPCVPVSLSPSLRVPHKRIRLPLVANCRDRSMAGIDDGVVRQRVHLLADAVEEHVGPAVEEVSATNAATEQHVATEHNSRLAPVHKHDVARRMPRDFKPFETNPGLVDDVTFGHREVGGWAQNGHAERRAQVRVGVGQQWSIVSSDDERRRRERLRQRGVASDVVGMAVRVENRRHFEILIADLLQNVLRVKAWIDDQTLVLVAKMHYVAILLEEGRNDRRDLQGSGHGLLKKHRRTWPRMEHA